MWGAWWPCSSGHELCSYAPTSTGTCLTWPCCCCHLPTQLDAISHHPGHIMLLPVLGVSAEPRSMAQRGKPQRAGQPNSFSLMALDTLMQSALLMLCHFSQMSWLAFNIPLFMFIAYPVGAGGRADAVESELPLNSHIKGPSTEQPGPQQCCLLEACLPAAVLIFFQPV